MSKKNFALIAVLVGIVAVAVISDKLVRRYVNLEGSGSSAVHDGGDDGDEVAEVVIADLPLRTPADSVDELSFSVDEEGVKEFRLKAQAFRWEYEPEHWVHAWGYNGQIPGPAIRVSEGDRVRVIVENELPNPTTVHWHGIAVGWEADGVPGVTQKAIAPGETFTYEFTATPAGTRWYHTHGADASSTAQQLDMGLSGAFIVEAAAAVAYDREYVLVLDEWEIGNDGANAALSQGHGAGGAHMGDPDYNTFTINGEVFPYIDPMEVKEGETVLIRIVNAGTTAFHPLHLHGHEFDVVALDGNPLVPSMKRNTYTIHPGETADFVITANNPGTWLFHCHHGHHASAGMVMLLSYDGFEPVTDLVEAAVAGHANHNHDEAIEATTEEDEPAGH